MLLRCIVVPQASGMQVCSAGALSQQEQPVFPASVGNYYRPLGLSCRTALNGILEIHVLVKADDLPSGGLSLCYIPLQNFEVVNKNIPVGWAINYSDSNVILIGDPITDDLEYLHDQLRAGDEFIIANVKKKVHC